ncbi:calcium-binding protein [Kineosporia babensis]|uniref:Calcium-binding protein n=1 Tax=Kineosporia babensis TaxID=499548 RepID=A0A9X1SS90_9ACTN|nr:calcium-binding protein [Kineosporia babensis]MCD5310407.1 hypothetical protein [Kineosporia babensis]
MRPLVISAASIFALTPLVFAYPAQAAPGQATASVNPEGWKLTYNAAPGQVNKIVASVESNDAGALVYLIDDSVPIDPGAGCEHLVDDDRTSVRCVVQPVDKPDPYATMTMSLRDKNDNVEFHNNTSQAFYFNEFRLGDGKDTLDSSKAIKEDGSFVWGQNGPDRITTGSVATVQGGEGADVLTANGSYSDLDGGKGDDKLWGGVGTQYLRGGPDDDVIHGGAGNDTLYGGRGDDKLYGEQGVDSIYGNSGDDFINGGKGMDKLGGGAGEDLLKP